MAGFFPTPPPSPMDPQTAQKLMNPGAAQQSTIDWAGLAKGLNDAVVARKRMDDLNTKYDDQIQDAVQDADEGD